MTDIGIVGAGAAAAAACFALDGSGADVTVLEKSRGVCGRAATRRRGECTYDYGANYVKPRDDRVVELLTQTLDDEGLVNVTEPVWTFDADGTVSPGREDEAPKWSYRAGLTQLAKRLFARTDATVENGTRVEQVVEDDGLWHLTDAEGTVWGPYDVLVVNPPAPQTAALLRTAEWDSPDREALVSAVSAVPYRSVWTAVLHYPFELDRPYYALVNPDKEHDVGWVSREECKPGHIPEGETLLVVQAGHEWSAMHYDRAAETNVAALAERTADLLDDERLCDPDWTDHQGWRYALPERGVDTAPVTAAEGHGLYCTGDWVAGEGRVHAALGNGLDVGERIAERV